MLRLRATLLAVLGRALTRGVDAIGLGGQTIGVAVDGGPLDAKPRALVLATTLDRLVLGSRPFWGTGEAPIHFTVFDHPARGLLRHARTILYGGRERCLPDPPYRSRGATRVELRLDGPFTIDGDSMEIGIITATQMACPPPADAVERAYLDALAQVAAGGWTAMLSSW